MCSKWRFCLDMESKDLADFKQMLARMSRVDVIVAVIVLVSLLSSDSGQKGYVVISVLTIALFLLLAVLLKRLSTHGSPALAHTCTALSVLAVILYGIKELLLLEEYSEEHVALAIWLVIGVFIIASKVVSVVILRRYTVLLIEDMLIPALSEPNIHEVASPEPQYLQPPPPVAPAAPLPASAVTQPPGGYVPPGADKV